MESVFIYWDNSNIFHEAQRFAGQVEDAPNVRYRVRIHFDNMLRLAHADRPIERAFAIGSVPPEMRQLWNRLDNSGVEVELLDRGEHPIPDRSLPIRMLQDALDYIDDPSAIVLLTGDGAGHMQGADFHNALKRMHRRGWRVEILSWSHSCNQRMRQWAEENGEFIALDDFYHTITFLEPSRPGFELAMPRYEEPVDLSRRKKA